MRAAWTLPALIAIAAPSAAIAQPSLAARLVETIASDQMLVELAGRLFDNHLRAETGLSDAQKALLAANPGLKQHVAEKVRPELTMALKRELPDLRGALTNLVEQDMTAQEIADTGTFLRTPTGQKVLARIYQSIGNSAVSDEKQARQVAMTALMASMGPDDYGPLLAFAGTRRAQVAGDPAEDRRDRADMGGTNYRQAPLAHGAAGRHRDSGLPGAQ